MVNLQVIVLTLNWSSCISLLAEVTGYVLLLTDMPHRGRCGGEGVADLNECECANITNPVGYIIYIYYTCMAASSSLELQKITWF